mmetsp:Transcript_22977/g.73954  ORF Transcript_22977/g.73954 Transcript_22977/m.73954 type:complete len:229 (-) Transcript_22977:1646-2332(-)
MQNEDEADSLLALIAWEDENRPSCGSHQLHAFARNVSQPDHELLAIFPCQVGHNLERDTLDASLAVRPMELDGQRALLIDQLHVTAGTNSSSTRLERHGHVDWPVRPCKPLHQDGVVGALACRGGRSSREAHPGRGLVVRTNDRDPFVRHSDGRGLNMEEGHRLQRLEHCGGARKRIRQFDLQQLISLRLCIIIDDKGHGERPHLAVLEVNSHVQWLRIHTWLGHART